MGSFYGSIHVRTGDREAVRTATEDVAKSRGIKCLIGPALGEWVGVYPEYAGQDAGVGADLAARIAGTVLHLMVHDDDVLAYWLYRDGVEVDSYISLPGYFGEEHRASDEAKRGQPELLAELAGGKVESLRTILDRNDGNRPVMSSEPLAQLAKCLKIANAATAYEDLKAGERHGIRGWRQFLEVPADAIRNERDARRQRTAAIQHVKNQAKRAGLLIEERTARKLNRLIWCIVGNQAWLAVRHVHDDHPQLELECIGGDSKSGATVSLDSGGRFWDIISDRARKHVAVTSIAHEERSVRVMTAVLDTSEKKASLATGQSSEIARFR